MAKNQLAKCAIEKGNITSSDFASILVVYYGITNLQIMDNGVR